MDNVVKRLNELGLTLPPCPTPVAAYLPAKMSGNLLFVSGQTPKTDAGKLIKTGKLGADVTVAEGYQLARVCCLRLLSAVQSVTGSLEAIEEVVKISGFVAGTADFYEHSRVINGISELLIEILGDRGRHSRLAVGVAALPGNAPLEAQMIVRVDPEKIPVLT